MASTLSIGSDRHWRVVAVAALGAAGVALALTTVRLGTSWHDSATLWERATAAQPDAFMARLKYGETLRDAGDWSGAVRQYQAAVHMRPNSSLGYVALFYLYAERAEAEGRLQPGTATRWLGKLGTAIDDRRRFDGLLAEVPHAACPPCSNSLLLLNLRRWPQADERLRTAARAALDAGLPDVALVFLSQARDQSAPDWVDLVTAARRTSGASP